MLVEVERTKEKHEIKGDHKVSELLEQLKIKKEEVLIAVDGKLLHDDDLINEKDSVKILSVISGG